MHANYWPIDYSQTNACGGSYKCNPGTYCGSPIQYNIPLEKDNVTINANINYGLSHFDNIFVATQFIFCILTLDGWSNDLYNYMDAGISGFAVVYFPLMAIMLAFFLLNYFLAIIMNTFRKMQQKNKEKMQMEKYKDAKIKKMIEISNQKVQ